MSCIYKYKGKDYTKDEFYSLVRTTMVQPRTVQKYEKVLFPSGNTASKVEGHTTLEEFKKQKEDRIKMLERQVSEMEENALDPAFLDELAFRNADIENGPSNVNIDEEINRNNEEIIQIKQELERVEREGFGALRPIYNFYENTITNILKKNGYSPNLIKDEYGNTWNEVTIDSTALNKILFQTSNKSNKIDKTEVFDKVTKGLEEYVKNNNINVEFLTTAINENDPVAVFNMIQKLIQINQGKADKTTLPEELAHHLTLALKDSILVNRAINLVNKVGVNTILDDEFDRYNTIYKGDKTLLAHEALGKLIAKTIASKLEQPNVLKSETSNKLWDTINRLLDKFISLFKANDNIMKNLQKEVDTLSNMILEGDKVEVSNFDAKMFQLGEKFAPEKHIKKQYYFFKDTLAKNKRQIAKFNKEILNNPKADKDKLLSSIEYLKNQMNDINKALLELETSGNKQLFTELAQATLDYAKKYLLKLMDDPNPTIKDDSINHLKEIIDNFSDFAPTSKEAIEISKDLLDPIIRKYALYNTNEATGLDVTDEMYDAKSRDIFVGTKNLGTLSDVNDILGQSIGYLIKKAQHEIALENNKAYEEVDKRVKALQAYTRSKGISDKDMYKVFIQEDRGTTVLTRAYTSAFYKRLDDSFQNKDTGKAERKTFAIWDSENEQWIPKDFKEYSNPNFKTINESKELKEFYDFYKNAIKDISDKLPISLNDNFIPNIAKETLLDVIRSDRSLMSKLKDGVQNITEIYDIKENSNGYVFDESRAKDAVPLRYIAKIDADKKSGDLGSSLLKFMYFANSYEHMSEVLPKTKLLLSEIEGKMYTKNTNRSKDISGEVTNIHQMAKKFIEMQVLGKVKNEEVLGKVQYGKIIDFGLKYTSLLRIGMNPFNATTNVAVGKIGNEIEAIGGRYFNTKELHKAESIFFKQVNFNDSKLYKLVALLNPLQELDDYENLEKVGIAYTQTEKYKEKLKNSMYYLQKTGEKYLQTTTMIASLMHDKITSLDGKTTVPLYEAFDEKGEWKTAEFGELTQDRIFKMSNKIQRINQSIHGRYSAKDSAILNQYALFRVFFQFRKWMPAAFEARFDSKRYDPRLGQEVEGRYHAYMKAFYLGVAKLRNDAEAMEKYGWTELDTYNMRKNISELVIVLATALAGFGMGMLGDDDKDLKKKGWYKFAMNQLDRVAGDITFFYNPMEMNRVAGSAAPMFKTVNDLGNVLLAFPHVFGMQGKKDIYRSGPKKGENKFTANVKRAVPFVKPIVETYSMFTNDDPYKAPSKR